MWSPELNDESCLKNLVKVTLNFTSIAKLVTDFALEVVRQLCWLESPKKIDVLTSVF